MQKPKPRLELLRESAPEPVPKHHPVRWRHPDKGWRPNPENHHRMTGPQLCQFADFNGLRQSPKIGWVIPVTAMVIMYGILALVF